MTPRRSGVLHAVGYPPNGHQLSLQLDVEACDQPSAHPAHRARFGPGDQPPASHLMQPHSPAAAYMLVRRRAACTATPTRTAARRPSTPSRPRPCRGCATSPTPGARTGTTATTSCKTPWNASTRPGPGYAVAARSTPTPRTTLVHRLISENRRAWRRRETATLDQVPTAIQHLAPDATGHALERLDVLDLLQYLPPRQRAIAILRFLEDVPVSEVADLLHCTEGTVKSQAHHARRFLRQHLTDPNSPDGARQ